MHALFLAPTCLISCKCGDLFAGYENGEVVKLHDAEYGEADLPFPVGGTVADYREDPECTGCGGDLMFSAV